MNDLDAEALAQVCDLVRKKLRRRELWVRDAPLRGAISQNMTSAKESDLLKETELDSRRSLESFERSVAEFSTRLTEADAERAVRLAKVRRRTAALRAWLESFP